MTMCAMVSHGDLAVAFSMVRKQTEYQVTLGYLSSVGHLVSEPATAGTGWRLDADGTLQIFGGLPEWAFAERQHDPCYGLIGSSSSAPWAALAPQIRRVVFHKGARAQTLSGAFANCVNLIEVHGVDRLDWSEVHSCDAMFSGCSALVAIDLYDVNAPALLHADDMFLGCHGLASVRFGPRFGPELITASGLFDTCMNLRSAIFHWGCRPELITMDNMFRWCTTLFDVDLSDIWVPEVLSVSSMFESCCALQNVDLSGVGTLALRSTMGMFCNCTTLLDLDLSGFRTETVENMAFMFYNCRSLRLLDLSSFDMRACGDVDCMLTGVPRSCRVFRGPHTYLPDWD